MVIKPGCRKHIKISAQDWVGTESADVAMEEGGPDIRDDE